MCATNIDRVDEGDDKGDQTTCIGIDNIFFFYMKCTHTRCVCALVTLCNNTYQNRQLFKTTENAFSYLLWHIERFQPSTNVSMCLVVFFSLADFFLSFWEIMNTYKYNGLSRVHKSRENCLCAYDEVKTKQMNTVQRKRERKKYTHHTHQVYTQRG